MKKIAFIALLAGLLTHSAHAIDLDRYLAVGGGNISFEEVGYEDGKSVHVKIGVTAEEGFGLELEYSQTIDALKDIGGTQDIDAITAGSYVTYRVIMDGEFSLKGRLGWLDRTFKVAGDPTDNEYSTDVSYGLSINYEPIQDQVVYLDYTISEAGFWDIVVISAGIQYFF